MRSSKQTMAGIWQDLPTKHHSLAVSVSHADFMAARCLQWRLTGTYTAAQASCLPAFLIPRGCSTHFSWT